MDVIKEKTLRNLREAAAAGSREDRIVYDLLLKVVGLEPTMNFDRVLYFLRRLEEATQKSRVLVGHEKQQAQEFLEKYRNNHP